MRVDLHGLCALCLFAVINNQLWPYYVLYGFYGIDIFFVVIGYETYRNLIKSRLKTNSNAIKCFSNLIFNQTKKYAPIYITICGWIVFACIFLISPSEFPQLVKQTNEAISFMSNFKFKYEETDYFPVSLSYKPFEHTWPISLTIQYALFIVLPLFLVYPSVKNQIFLIFIAILTLTSFFYYKFTSIELPKTLFDRGWQFGLGFLAFALSHQKDVLWKDLDKINGGFLKSCENQYRFSIFDERRQFYPKSICLTILLLILMVAPLPIPSQIYRPILSLTGFLIIIVGKHEPCLLLDNKIFKLFSQVGFTAYMCFWPLFNLYKYCFSIHWYVPKQDGLLFLILPYALAYLTYLFMKRYLELIDKWWKLLISILLSYLFVFAMLNSMSNYKIISYTSPLSLEQQNEVKEMLTYLYKTHEHQQIFTERQAMRYNSLIFAYSHNEHFCKNKQNRIFVYKFYYFDFVCVEKGTGNQTMLIVGDKSARELLHGVRYHFNNIYSKLIVISSNSCVPFLNDNFGFGSVECLKFSKQIRELVMNWPTGIDLLLLSYQYLEGYKPPVNDMKSDKYFQALNDFYQFMDKHVNGHIFLPNVNIVFNLPPAISYIQKRLFFQLDLSVFSISIEDHKRHLKSVQQRVDAIECKKCLKIDMSHVFCSPIDSICYAIDLRRKLTYFRDENQLNALGSMFFGEYLLMALKNQTNNFSLFKTIN